MCTALLKADTYDTGHKSRSWILKIEEKSSMESVSVLMCHFDDDKII